MGIDAAPGRRSRAAPGLVEWNAGSGPSTSSTVAPFARAAFTWASSRVKSKTSRSGLDVAPVDAGVPEPDSAPTGACGQECGVAVVHAEEGLGPMRGGRCGGRRGGQEREPQARGRPEGERA